METFLHKKLALPIILFVLLFCDRCRGDARIGLNHKDDTNWLLDAAAQQLKLSKSALDVRDISTGRNNESHQVVLMKNNPSEIICTAVLSTKADAKNTLFIDTIQVNQYYSEKDLSNLIVQYAIERIAPRLGYTYVVARSTDDDAKSLLTNYGFQTEATMVKDVTSLEDCYYLSSRMAEIVECSKNEIKISGLPLGTRGEFHRIKVSTCDSMPLCSIDFYNRPETPEMLVIENIFIHSPAYKKEFSNILIDYVLKKVASRLGYKSIQMTVSDEESIGLLKKHGFAVRDIVKSAEDVQSYNRKQRQAQKMSSTVRMFKDMTAVGE